MISGILHQIICDDMTCGTCHLRLWDCRCPQNVACDHCEQEPGDADEACPDAKDGLHSWKGDVGDGRETIRATAACAFCHDPLDPDAPTTIEDDGHVFHGFVCLSGYETAKREADEYSLAAHGDEFGNNFADDDSPLFFAGEQEGAT